MSPFFPIQSSSATLRYRTHCNQLHLNLIPLDSLPVTSNPPWPGRRFLWICWERDCGALRPSIPHPALGTFPWCPRPESIQLHRLPLPEHPQPCLWALPWRVRPGKSFQGSGYYGIGRTHKSLQKIATAHAFEYQT